MEKLNIMDGRKLWWVSFAGEEGFRGAVMVRADGFLEAVTETHWLGVNPGGEALGFDWPDERAALVPESYMNRLLSKAELEVLDGIAGGGGGLVDTRTLEPDELPGCVLCGEKQG